LEQVIAAFLNRGAVGTGGGLEIYHPLQFVEKVSVRRGTIRSRGDKPGQRHWRRSNPCGGASLLASRIHVDTDGLTSLFFPANFSRSECAPAVTRFPWSTLQTLGAIVALAVCHVAQAQNSEPSISIATTGDVVTPGPAPFDAKAPGATLATPEAELIPIPSADEVQYFGPDGSVRPLWRWLPRSNGRHSTLGQPLERSSWLNRPFQISPIAGAFIADDLLKGRINGSTGYLTGFRVGWDMSHYWGFETRFGFTSYGLDYPPGGAQLGDAKGFLFDSNVMYYPLGDTAIRPFATLGVGLGDFQFYDEFAQLNHPTVFNMPFGGGVKFHNNGRWAFRFDVIDNLSFDGGRQSDTMHNISITAGLEARFGFGPRRSYYPWNPSRAWY